jgi:LCP family protein required for cell wall assembly
VDQPASQQPSQPSSSSPTSTHLPPPSLRTSQQRSERIKLRRALGFLGMTLVLPGSAQVAAGNKVVGRIALRTWIVLWSLLLVLGIGALVRRSAVLSVFTNATTLVALQVSLVVLGIGWALLFLDAWRLARPPELARRHRLGFAALSGVLAFAVVGGLVASATIVSSQRSLMTTVFAGGGETKAQAGRYNILLLGGDAGKGRDGLRPDSLTVASVDADTGRTVLISLPRNMEDVPFPAGSPMREKFPKGFGCKDHTCMLNAVYTYASTHRDLYPDSVKDPGVRATKEAVEGATGLKINYYAMVDLKGFQALVDAVGGIRIDVNRNIPIGGGESKLYGYVKEGKNQLLDGRSALWFARSRSDSSDYDRMARQKCVMTAMLKQLDPVTVLTNFNAIAAAGKEIVETDIPPGKIDTMVELAMKAKEKPISSVALVPPVIYPGSPDVAKMHKLVANKIAKSEAKDDPSAQPTPSGTKQPTGSQPTTLPAADPASSSSSSSSSSSASPSSSRKPKQKKTATLKPGQQTDDLASVCSAS